MRTRGMGDRKRSQSGSGGGGVQKRYKDDARCRARSRNHESAQRVRKDSTSHSQIWLCSPAQRPRDEMGERREGVGGWGGKVLPRKNTQSLS